MLREEMKNLAYITLDRNPDRPHLLQFTFHTEGPIGKGERMYAGAILIKDKPEIRAALSSQVTGQIVTLDEFTGGK